MRIEEGLEMRLHRPPLHRPLDCPKYDMIRGHENYQFDGACRNFKPMEEYCVFCNACPMSAAFLGVPFDARFEYDKAMGW
jgi:hypothetical protein